MGIIQDAEESSVEIISKTVLYSLNILYLFTGIPHLLP